MVMLVCAVWLSYPLMNRIFYVWLSVRALVAFFIHSILLTSLFTCEVVVPHGPGMASQGTSAPDLLALVSIRRGAAQLVRSQLFVGSFENSLFLSLFTYEEILFQSSITLRLKKFRRMSNLPCLTQMFSGSAPARVDHTLSPAISNHVSGFRPPLGWRILWTMLKSAWCLLSSREIPVRTGCCPPCLPYFL